ncbi:hypothetical protein MICAH_3710018 [Microcystis aeruginosa PCC 9809]|uniref:Uncharacterized protein n=1 Tax=Microcystis aeruginosa PCC 9809 TaxID=1160285 RepID=I4HVF5_MICAE|nr:hypothetical protein MICAH_3710018 [Microcystis aeruginosa PCC 9809]
MDRVHPQELCTRKLTNNDPQDTFESLTNLSVPRVRNCKRFWQHQECGLSPVSVVCLPLVCTGR